MGYISQKGLKISERIIKEISHDISSPGYGERIMDVVYDSFELDYCHMVELGDKGKVIYLDRKGFWNNDVYYTPEEDHDMIKLLYYGLTSEYVQGRLDNQAHKILSYTNPLNELVSRYIPELDILSCIHKENVALVSMIHDKRGFNNEQVNLYNLLSILVVREYLNNRNYFLLEDIHTILKPDLYEDTNQKYVLINEYFDMLINKDRFLKQLQKFGLSWGRVKLLLCLHLQNNNFVDRPVKKEIKIKGSLCLDVKPCRNKGRINYIIILKNKRANIFNLTERETDIALLVKKGCSNRMISEELLISEETVKKHLNNIFRKTSSRNRTELAHKIIPG